MRAYRVVRMEEQVAVARTKAAQIDDWTTERLIDLRFVVETLRSFPIFDPAAKPEVAALAELVLAQFLSAYPERVAVGVFRPDGRPIIVQGRFDPLLADALRADIEETAKRNKPYIGVVNPGGAHETGLSLAFMAPLAGPNRTGTDRLVVASVVDPTVALLKRFGEWPAAGKGTLTLGFRSGDELVQIVDAGKQMGSAVLSVRAAIPEERLTRVLADTRGEASWRGIGQGGQQTLTAAYAVKDMPWTVIARTDLKEAMAPISRQIWALWVATAVVIAFGGLLMLTVRSQMKLSRLLAHV